MRVEVPIGDVVDRVTILRIKVARLGSAAAQANAAAELAALEEAWAAEGLPPLDSLPETAPLAACNTRLWEVEDALRACEARGDFGPDFVALARAVYQTNDARARWKRAISTRLGSRLIEEKGYGTEGGSR